MSFFQKLFGFNDNKPQVPTTEEAVQKLLSIEDMLYKKQEYLEKKVDQELRAAKANGTKNKRVALQALKRKKRYEKQLQQIDGTLTTIEYQREALESASSNTEVLKVLGFAAKALKGAQNMDVDDVHELMEDVHEQQEVANEISEAISNPLGFDREFDDDELARELELLEQEDLDEQLLDVKPEDKIQLPDVPNAEPSNSKKRTEVDKDLEELAQWAT